MSIGDFARTLCDPAFLRGLGLVHDYSRYRARVSCELEVMGSCTDFSGTDRVGSARPWIPTTWRELLSC